MHTKFDRRAARDRRHRRVRKSVHGAAERPRLAVFRSLNHIGVQLIDDAAGHTLAAASTHDPDIRKELAGKGSAASSVTLRSLFPERRFKIVGSQNAIP